jgi:hypothetical protein
MNIPVVQARSVFTQELIATYKERVKPTAFLRSFFPTKLSSTKLVSIEVSRGDEKIASDVELGDEGERNTFSKSTQKTFLPPYYRQFFDMTELDHYDVLFGTGGTINESMFADVLRSGADKLEECQNKIERSYELQCAQVLLDGIVQRKKGLNINYNRKAASLIDLGSTTGYWSASASHDVYADFEAAAVFLRTVGKVQGGTINVILGSTAIATLFNNTLFKERQNLFNMALDAVRAAQRDALGSAYHGQITAGAYRFNLWSYPEFYKDRDGNIQPYIDPKKVIFLPEQTNFRLAFGAVPQIVKEGTLPTAGAYMVGEKKDEYDAIHRIDIKSRGLAVPVAVDQIYTLKVIV